jgi:3-hydroxyacyl-CoA dehydrogenase
MSLEINKVGIIGTGLIGAGWAAFYASKGFAVNLYDAAPSGGQFGFDKTLEYLSFLQDQSVLDPAQYEKAVNGVRIAKDLPDAVFGVQLIQESGPENYEIKKKIFHEIDEHTGADVIVLSSSSGLLITELQKVMALPERSLIAHPFNPPHLIPLVELVPGEKTDKQLLSEVKEFFASLGKIPVILKKEIPGHIANRLQAAVWREAINMVLADVASVEDIDKALFAGPGLRWALMGQHLTFQLGGGEVWHFIIQDYVDTVQRVAPDKLDSLGIASTSRAYPPSTGSIITPEPTMLALLLSGGMATLICRRK